MYHLLRLTTSHASLYFDYALTAGRGVSAGPGSQCSKMLVDHLDESRVIFK
jgi:hypothetical protein